jgi:hypothetical protein
MPTVELLCDQLTADRYRLCRRHRAEALRLCHDGPAAPLPTRPTGSRGSPVQYSVPSFEGTGYQARRYRRALSLGAVEG